MQIPSFGLLFLLACGGRTEPDGVREVDASEIERHALADVASDTSNVAPDADSSVDVVDSSACPVEHAPCFEPGKAWCVGDGFGYLLCAGGTWELYQCATRYDETVCTHGGVCVGPKCL